MGLQRKKWAPQTQQNVSLRGGSEQLKYFGFIGYTKQDPIWKNNGGGYDRFNLQSNIDVKINDDLSVQLLISALVDQTSQTARGDGVWGDLWTSLPIYPGTLPDATKNSYANGSGVGSIALSSNEKIFGYLRNNRQNAKATFIADYKIRAVEGLSAKAFVNYDKSDNITKDFSTPYQFYTYNYANNMYTLVGSLGSAARLIYNTGQNRNITGQFSLNYDHIFNNDHHITALALYEAIDYANSSISAGRDNFLTPAVAELFAGSVPTSTANSSAYENGRASYVGRLNYSYKDKYLLETSLRADASARFAENKRWGYFPSISLGWNIDREGFMKNISVVDRLKLRASYGSSGLDNVGNFQYLSIYSISGQWLYGNGTQPGIVSNGLSNANLSWETIKIYNLGVDFSLWNNKLFGTAEAFYRKRMGMPASRILTLPSTFGASLPQENLNSQNNRGFELSLGTNGKTGDLSYTISANVSYSRAKWDHYEEQVFTDPDQIRLRKSSGQWVDRAVGYISDGLFTSQQEINDLKFTYPQGNAGLRPGDIKFVDLNGDGKLDFKDQTDIGSGTVPNWMGGMNINLNYKSFDLQALFQGAFNFYSQVLTDKGSLNYSKDFYETLWTEKNNNANAYTPRIGGSSSNGLFSDHFYRKVNYLRLKTFALGYSLPQSLLNHAKIKKARLYLAGTNLLTISPLNKFYIDPEAPSGVSSGNYYPQQRTISVGLNVTL
ncbi:MAG: SusC/RagA family TonB-linked outer membrane protein [Sphingobacteriaceae bacterium]|nr:MAG: SusC/RagA family TonB-linked outer membrane protein [Sphingobacteriaceae bacterium]